MKSFRVLIKLRTKSLATHSSILLHTYKNIEHGDSARFLKNEGTRAYIFCLLHD